MHGDKRIVEGEKNRKEKKKGRRRREEEKRVEERFVSLCISV